MILLALDPGKKNCGFSVVQCKQLPDRTAKARVLASGNLTYPVNNIGNNVQSQLEWFTQECTLLLDKYNAQCIVAERFMNRGFQSGTTIETVGVMLGGLTMYFTKYNIPVYLVTPSTWKNAFNNIVDKSYLKNTYSLCRTPPHELDAALIGIYWYHKLNNIKPYTHYIIEQNRDKLLYYVEKVSTSKLVNRRKKRRYYCK